MYEHTTQLICVHRLVGFIGGHKELIGLNCVHRLVGLTGEHTHLIGLNCVHSSGRNNTSTVGLTRINLS